MIRCKCGKKHGRHDTLNHCPFEPIYGEKPATIKKAGYCPGCKNELDQCVCLIREPGSLFDAS
jgi:hypothetical protein